MTMDDMTRYPYRETKMGQGEASMMPLLPLRLAFNGHEVDTSGLLDTGATVNVLPYDLGLQLGARWEEQTTPVQLSGNLARLGARVLIVRATVAEFEPVRLAFAWTESRGVPLLLGEVNFFMEFDVCFYRSRRVFEIRSGS